MKRLTALITISTVLWSQTKVDYPTQIKNGPVVIDTSFATLQQGCDAAATGHAILNVTKQWNNVPTTHCNAIVNFVSSSARIEPANGAVFFCNGYTAASRQQVWLVDTTGVVRITGPGMGSQIFAGNFSTFFSACDTAGVAVSPVYVTTPVSITANTTCSTNITAQFGGVLTMNNAVLTLTAGFTGDLSQHFAFSGTGSLNLASAKIAASYPQWYGAACDGATDDTVPVQSALSLSPVNGLVTIAGVCALSANVFVPSATNGLRVECTGLGLVSPASCGFKAIGTTPFQMMSFYGRFPIVSNLTVNCNNVATDGFVLVDALGGVFTNDSATGCVKVQTAATTATQATIGSYTITVASAAGIQPEQSVCAGASCATSFLSQSTGLYTSTFVVSVSGTTVTLSRPTTAVLSGTQVRFYDPTTGNGWLFANQGGPSTTPTTNLPVPTSSFNVVNPNVPGYPLTTIPGLNFCTALVFDAFTANEESIGFTISGSLVTLSTPTTLPHTTSSTVKCNGNNDRAQLFADSAYDNAGWGLQIFAGSDNNSIHEYGFDAEVNGLGGESWSGSVNAHFGGSSQGNGGPALQLGDLRGGFGLGSVFGKFTAAVFVAQFLDLENTLGIYNAVYSVCDNFGTVNFENANQLLFNNAGLGTFTVAAGGSGWTTGNIVSIPAPQGTSAVNGTAVVTAAAGVVTALTPQSPGFGYSTVNNLAVSGAGTGLKVNITGLANGPFCPAQFAGNSTLGTGTDSPGAGVPQWTIKSASAQQSFQPGSVSTTPSQPLSVAGSITSSQGWNYVNDSTSVPGAPGATLLLSDGTPVLLADGLRVALRLGAAMPAGGGNSFTLNGVLAGVYSGFNLGTFSLAHGYGALMIIYMTYSGAGGYWLVDGQPPVPPTSCTGQVTGTLFNNAGVAAFCP